VAAAPEEMTARLVVAGAVTPGSVGKVVVARRVRRAAEIGGGNVSSGIVRAGGVGQARSTELRRKRVHEAAKTQTPLRTKDLSTIKYQKHRNVGLSITNASTGFRHKVVSRI